MFCHFLDIVIPVRKVVPKVIDTIRIIAVLTIYVIVDPKVDFAGFVSRGKFPRDLLGRFITLKVFFEFSALIVPGALRFWDNLCGSLISIFINRRNYPSGGASIVGVLNASAVVVGISISKLLVPFE